MRLACILLLATTAALAAEPIRLHPDNPHYYLFRGKPTVLVTSAEHYGAVLNLDFNYAKYLDTLARDGLNLTRIFAGQYHEIPGDFGITANTLAPTSGRFLAPYRKVNGVYDLKQWNPDFFQRLRAFVQAASDRGIVVEVTLFCVFYEDRMWNVAPLNAKNNGGATPAVPREEALSLKHPAMVRAQEEFVRKVAAELASFDNVIFEICNEPYVRNLAAGDWQTHIARVLAESEAVRPARHVIARNIANNSARVADPDPNVSVLNFHYARPPVAVAENYAHGRVIGLDETGFDGTLDAIYRIQAWDFLVAGGAHYNNLDYSFAVGHEDGTFLVQGNAPGGGGADLRKQLKILLDFFGRLNFAGMAPSAEAVAPLPEGISARALTNGKDTWAVYLHTLRILANHRPRGVYRTDRRQFNLPLNLPAGRWQAEWWHTRTGVKQPAGLLDHPGGVAHIAVPEFTEDAAVVLRRQ